LSLESAISSGIGAIVKTKVPDLLPPWLERLYKAYGDPVVRPDPWDEGVRFFDGSRTLHRRTWAWRHNRIHYKVYIDQWREGYEIVAERFTDEGILNSADTYLKLSTHLPPTDRQIEGALDAAGFVER